MTRWQFSASFRDDRSVFSGDPYELLPPPHPPGHEVPFIDGAKNPEAIPDAVAYRMFLRMLTTPEATARGAKMHRAYVRNVLRHAEFRMRTTQPNAPAINEPGGSLEPTAEQIDNVLRFVASYEPRLRQIDEQRRQLHAAGQKQQAVALQANIDSLVTEAIRSMPSITGKEVAAKLNLYVKTEYKKRIKITGKQDS